MSNSSLGYPGQELSSVGPITQGHRMIVLEAVEMDLETRKLISPCSSACFLQVEMHNQHPEIQPKKLGTKAPAKIEEVTLMRPIHGNL